MKHETEDCAYSGPTDADMYGYPSNTRDVARALAQSSGCDPDEIEDDGEPSWTAFVHHAAAAIRAMDA